MAAALALVSALFTIILHNSALLLTSQDPVSNPISALSRGPYGNVHTLGLMLFALAHLALAAALQGSARGKLWRLGRFSLVIDAVLTVYVANYFITAPEAVLSGPSANDPLSILACSTGLTMALLWSGLKRHHPFLWVFNFIWLGLWLLLVPLILLVTESWQGGYERLVGIVYVAWIMGMAAGLLIAGRRSFSPPHS